MTSALQLAPLVSVFVAALLGSPHCGGMCGGLVGFCSAGSGQCSALRVQFAYNGARLLVYMLLGASAGALGNAVDTVSVHFGFGDVALFAAGVVMLGSGGIKLAALGRKRVLLRKPSQSGVGAVLARCFARLQARGPLGRALIVGAATALLPCGWLYLFVVAAGGSGGPLAGALLMVAFWLGTVPVLLGLGVFANKVTTLLRGRVALFHGLTMVALGLYTLFGRWDVPGSITNLAYVGAAVTEVAVERGVDSQSVVSEVAPLQEAAHAK